MRFLSLGLIGLFGCALPELPEPPEPPEPPEFHSSSVSSLTKTIEDAYVAREMGIRLQLELLKARAEFSGRLDTAYIRLSAQIIQLDSRLRAVESRLDHVEYAQMSTKIRLDIYTEEKK